MEVIGWEERRVREICCLLFKAGFITKEKTNDAGVTCNPAGRMANERMSNRTGGKPGGGGDRGETELWGVKEKK